MKISHEQFDQVAILELVGEMTDEELEPFNRLVAQCQAESPCDFVLDISELETIDSKGLEALLKLQEDAGESLRQIRLVAPGENVRTILHVTRLEHAFELQDDVEGALQSLL